MERPTAGLTESLGQGSGKIPIQESEKIERWMMVRAVQNVNALSATEMDT